MQNLWLTVYGAISDAVHSSFPLINLILPLIAGCLGCLICGKIRDSLRDTLLRALGLLVFLMGGVELWNGFFVLQTAEFETKGTLLVLVSLVAGYLLGYGLNLDLSLGKLGLWLYRLFVKDKPTKAAVIYTIESVFACTLSVVLGYDQPSARLFIGGALIVSAILVTEVKLPGRKSKEELSQ